jgi:hypothetical protein
LASRFLTKRVCGISAANPPTLSKLLLAWH